jgi:hypothetical protein
MQARESFHRVCLVTIRGVGWLALALSFGCPQDTEQPGGSPGAAGTSAPEFPLSPPAPSPDPPGPPRDIEARPGSSCLTMYSWCQMVDGKNQCTSARFSLECNEVGRLPSTRELLRCVCP